MQITELLKLIEWFNINVVGNEIPNKYSELFKKMNQNIKRQPNVPLIPFEVEKINLCNAIKYINFQSLSIEQIRFLEVNLEIVDLLGEKGINLIDDTLFKNSLDMASAVNIIKNKSEKINQATMTIAELKVTLGKSFSITEDEVDDGFVLMRIYFQNDSSINNLADLKKFSEIWYDIGRGIAMAQSKVPEDFRIIGAEKGSIILICAVATIVATTVCSILLKTLKVAERIFDLKIKAEELRAMKLQNNEAERALEKEIEYEKEQGLRSILESIVTELGSEMNNQGDIPIVLEKSIKTFIDFIENGGNVDFVQPKENVSAEQILKEKNKELISYIKEIRKLDKNIRQFENKLLTTS
jgi:hypothetical protein